MSWQKYSLAFRLLSPLHIGWRKVSNLMQTRRYVTGNVLWAALTARLTREAGHGADGQKYVEIGKEVNENFRFGYLYPALARDLTQSVVRTSDLYIHYPWSDAHFDYRFLDSQVGTALNYDQQAAEDGLLHETEFIRPHARGLTNREQAAQVYLLGDLFVRTLLPNHALQNWQVALTQLQLGGERGYGWGRVQHLPFNPAESVDSPEVTLLQGTSIWGHLQTFPEATQSSPEATQTVSSITGTVEPIIGWERNNSKENQRWRLTPQANICYAPGSVVNQQSIFRIGAYGIWRMTSQ